MDRAGQDFFDLCRAWGNLTPWQRNRIYIRVWSAKYRAGITMGMIFLALLLLRLFY